jgi:hypothetical protein
MAIAPANALGVTCGATPSLERKCRMPHGCVQAQAVARHDYQAARLVSP